MNKKILKGLEEEIMEIVWNKKNCTIREVVDEVNENKDLAYTTIATTLNRLYKKGLLIKNSKKGVIQYQPKVTQESYIKTNFKKLFNKFIGSYGDLAVSSFAESIEELPKEEKEKLLKLLNEYNKKSNQ